MTEKKTDKTFIVISGTVAGSLFKQAVNTAILIGAIGLGVWLESAAMQWTGAVVFFLALFARGSGKYKEMTREQAIKHLQEMEG